MHKKQTLNIKNLIACLLFLGFFLTLFNHQPQVSVAAPACGTPDRCETAAKACRDTGGSWDSAKGTCETRTSEGLITGVNDSTGRVEEYLQLAVNIFTATSTLAIVASVIIFGIQYSASGGNPQATAKAKERINGAFIALIATLLLYAFLQWLIPGGVFS